MPRIYTSRSEPEDFCKRCFPKTEAAAFKAYGKDGDGPDGRGNCFEYNAEHPDFQDADYGCSKCGKQLTENDN